MKIQELLSVIKHGIPVFRLIIIIISTQKYE